MTHSKKALAALSKSQLVSTLLFLLAFLKRNNPKAYHAAESKMGLSRRPAKGHKKKKGKKSRRSSAKRRPSAAQMKARNKFKAFIKKHGRPPRKGEHL